MSNDRLPFVDRRGAGVALAAKLAALPSLQDPAGAVVLALPRGGVPVAYEVARALSWPLDVFLVRKLGVPGHRELAMGAIASGGIQTVNDDVVEWYGVSEAEFAAVAQTEQEELERREVRYRGQRAPLPVEGRTVLLVDDGLATGSSMKAAVQAVRVRAPRAIVVAVPVGPREACEALGAVSDDLVCLRQPEPFSAVGQWYRDFAQVDDEEVRRLLGTGIQRETDRPT